MRASFLMALPLLAACAQQPAPAPVATAPAQPPIMVPNAIAPRLLPGAAPAPTANLTPAQQAEITLQRTMRADQQSDRLNAVDPQRPQQFGQPVGLPSDMGDAQYPEQPSNIAPIFQRR